MISLGGYLREWNFVLPLTSVLSSLVKQVLFLWDIKTLRANSLKLKLNLKETLYYYRAMQESQRTRKELANIWQS